MKNSNVLLMVMLVAINIAGCGTTGSATLPAQVKITTVTPLIYSLSDNALDVARDVSRQFPQLSAFHQFPYDLHNPFGSFENIGVLVTQEGNLVHLEYRHDRVIITGPNRSEVMSSTVCDLTVLAVPGSPGKFTVSASPVTERIGKEMFIPLPPVASLEKIAADIENVLTKLRQSDTARETASTRNYATNGNPYAQNSLGTMYEKGIGMLAEYDEAATWYRKSAEQGYAPAQYSLARLYSEGKGISQNYIEAAKWYRKAAEQGHVDAQNNLGVLYANGNGVLQDYVQAYKWWIIVKATVAPGSETYGIATHNMTMYANQMTSGQIARAQQEASAWTAAHSGKH